MDMAELAERVAALEALRDDTMIASKHGAQIIRIIEKLSERLGRVETQLAILQRANETAN